MTESRGVLTSVDEVAAVIAGVSAGLAGPVGASEPAGLAGPVGVSGLAGASAPGARLVVGIVGEPGAGKSTIAGELVAALGPTAALLPMDGYHYPQARLVQLGRRDRMGAPDTFDVDAFVAALAAVHNSGRTQYANDFNREIEEPVEDAVTFLPELRTIVVEGNYLLLGGGGGGGDAGGDGERASAARGASAAEGASAGERASAAEGDPGWQRVGALLDLTFFVEVEPRLRQSRLIARHQRFGKSAVDATAWALGPDESNARTVRASAARADYVIRL